MGLRYNSTNGEGDSTIAWSRETGSNPRLSLCFYNSGIYSEHAYITQNGIFTGNLTVNSNINLNNLSASRPIFTNSSKDLVSRPGQDLEFLCNQYTGFGQNAEGIRITITTYPIL